METPTTTATAAAADVPADGSVEKRLDRIETAFASALGINLDHHDPQTVVAARRQRIAEAAEKAAGLVKEAFVEADLTVEERLHRIEAALNSRGALS